MLENISASIYLKNSLSLTGQIKNSIFDLIGKGPDSLDLFNEIQLERLRIGQILEIKKD